MGVFVFRHPQQSDSLALLSLKRWLLAHLIKILVAFPTSPILESLDFSLDLFRHIGLPINLSLLESVWTLLIIGVVVGFNNLAVSFTLGALDKKKYFLRILFAFGLSEFTVPLIGAWLGKKISKLILEFTWWLGPFFLVVLGIVTFFSDGFSADKQDKLAEKLVSWKGLFILAIGLSFDNLIVGFSFGLQGISPLLLASTIAMFSICFAAVGLLVGSKTKKNFDKITVKVTGVLLISLGILTFLEVV